MLSPTRRAPGIMIFPLFVDIPWFSVLVASIGDSVSRNFSLEKAWWSTAPNSSSRSLLGPLSSHLHTAVNRERRTA